MAKPSSYRDESVADTLKQIFPGFLKIAAVVVVIGLALWGISRLNTGTEVTFNYPEAKKPFDIVRSYNPSVGKADSKVVVLVVEDPQCPNCAVYNGIVNAVKEKYGDRVRFVTKLMPLENIHAFAREASRSFYAAEKQGKLKEFTNLAYIEQDKLSLNQLDDWAKRAGLNIDQFRKDKSSKEVDSFINNDMKDLNIVRLPTNTEHASPARPGVEAGRLSGTPSTVIYSDGEVYDWWSGAAQQEQLETVIEKALAKASGETSSSSSSSSSVAQ